jgi:carbohydrate-selective porin OprB
MNFTNGRYEPGNHAAYALMDDQLTRTSQEHPERGLYAGVSAMTAASHFNAYDRYYETRLYKIAPFVARPLDVASMVSTYTGFSKSLTDSLVANGTGVWRNSASLTTSYNFHLAPGSYLSVGLSYVRGPAIKPRVDDALTSRRYIQYSFSRCECAPGASFILRRFLRRSKIPESSSFLPPTMAPGLPLQLFGLTAA